jgi:hypothetical protein
VERGEEKLGELIFFRVIYISEWCIIEWVQYHYYYSSKAEAAFVIGYVVNCFSGGFCRGG